MRQQTLRLLLLPLLLALSACAGRTAPEAGTAGAAAPEGHVLVRVDNDAIPPTSLTVWVVPETGIRTMLGTVNPSATKTFHFEPTLATTRYRLLARTTAGQELVSRDFTFAGTTGVEWDVSTNTIAPITG